MERGAERVKWLEPGLLGQQSSALPARPPCLNNLLDAPELRNFSQLLNQSNCEYLGFLQSEMFF